VKGLLQTVLNVEVTQDYNNLQNVLALMTVLYTTLTKKSVLK